MTAVEEIQAAIEKLTDLKDAANNWTSTIQPSRYWGSLSGPVISHQEASERFKSLEEALHRTIDAQLVLLKRGLVWANLATKGQSPDFLVDVELALARAINGSTS